jgi:hypothetical protein
VLALDPDHVDPVPPPARPWARADDAAPGCGARRATAWSATSRRESRAGRPAGLCAAEIDDDVRLGDVPLTAPARRRTPPMSSPTPRDAVLRALADRSTSTPATSPSARQRSADDPRGAPDASTPGRRAGRTFLRGPATAAGPGPRLRRPRDPGLVEPTLRRRRPHRGADRVRLRATARPHHGRHAAARWCSTRSTRWRSARRAGRGDGRHATCSTRPRTAWSSPGGPSRGGRVRPCTRRLPWHDGVVRRYARWPRARTPDALGPRVPARARALAGWPPPAAGDLVSRRGRHHGRPRRRRSRCAGRLPSGRRELTRYARYLLAGARRAGAGRGCARTSSATRSRCRSASSSRPAPATCSPAPAATSTSSAGRCGGRCPSGRSRCHRVAHLRRRAQRRLVGRAARACSACRRW